MSRAIWVCAANVLLSISVAAAQQTAGASGAVNFIQGQAALQGQPLGPGVAEDLDVGAGQTLSTAQGKVEVLLTPGAFLRLGDQAAIKMSAESPTDTRVELLHGEAILEVVHLGAGRLEVVDGPARTDIERAGIYEFKAGQPAVAVIDGMARVQENDHSFDLGKGRELTWRGDAAGGAASIHQKSLDADPLYAWSLERSREDAVASVNTAEGLVGTNPDNWRGANWYWNPFYATWAYLPASYTLAGPFGEKYFSARFYNRYPGEKTYTHGYFEAPDSHGYFTAAE